MKLLTFLFIMILLSSFASASCDSPSYTYKKSGNALNYHFKCYDATRTYCNSQTTVLLNVDYPNGTTARDNVSMTFNPTFFNATLPLDADGCYSVIISSPTLNFTSTFTYLSTPTGFDYSIEESITYILMFLVLVGFWFLALWGAIKIPFANTSNREGQVIKINWKKYSKIGCIAVCYFLFVWVVFLAWNISFGFLHLGSMATAFYYLYRLTFALSLPIFVLTIIISAILYIHDQKFQDKLAKGYWLTDE